MTEDMNIVTLIEKAPENIKEFFAKQSLSIPDDTYIERNTKIFKAWVVEIYFDGVFKKFFGFSKVGYS